MEAASVEVIDFEDVDGNTSELIHIESIHESIHSADESIHSKDESIHQGKWISSAEAKHRLRLNQPAFVRAIAELTDEHGIPHSALRRGKARNTEYSELAIALVAALPKKALFNRLKNQYFSSTEEVSIVAPLKFKENANNQLATSNSRILGLQQESKIKLQQLQQLYGQWQEAEDAEKSAQQKDLEAQEAQWELECIDEVMREEMFKKTRKREIKQMLKNSGGAI